MFKNKMDNQETKSKLIKNYKGANNIEVSEHKESQIIDSSPNNEIKDHENQIAQNKNNISVSLKPIESSGITTFSKLITRVKPKFYKLLRSVITDHFDSVLYFLDYHDLANLRHSNKLFQSIVHENFPQRLRFEVERIKYFQEQHYDHFITLMKNIDSQIPLSYDNWLDFDLGSVIQKLRIIDKNVISSLRSIKKIPKMLPDTVFAPFCIIMYGNVISLILEERI